MIPRMLFLMATVTAGCAGAGKFDTLAHADQERFRRCMKPIEPALCGNITSSVYETMCLRDGQAKYADLATDRARMEWLVANGCPASMVQPEKAVQ